MKPWIDQPGEDEPADSHARWNGHLALGNTLLALLSLAFARYWTWDPLRLANVAAFFIFGFFATCHALLAVGWGIIERWRARLGDDG